MLITKNMLRHYLMKVIKEASAKDVGKIEIQGEEYIIYNSLIDLNSFVNQIIAGQTEGATGFGQEFERVMLNFIDQYGALNSGNFNFPFADVYEEVGGITHLYSVKMKRIINPTLIGGGAIKISQIRKALNNLVSVKQFLNKPIQFGLLGGELDPLAYQRVRHIGLPIKMTQIVPSPSGPIYTLKKAYNEINFKGFSSGPLYPADDDDSDSFINESYVKNQPGQGEQIVIEIENASERYAQYMLGSGNPNDDYVYAEMTDLGGAFAINADDKIFTTLKNDSRISNDEKAKQYKERYKIAIQSGRQQDAEIFNFLYQDALRKSKGAIEKASKPADGVTHIISTKDKFIEHIMDDKYSSKDSINVIITGGYNDAAQAIAAIERGDPPLSMTKALLEKIDSVIVNALPTLEALEDTGKKGAPAFRPLGVLYVSLLTKEKMIEKTKELNIKEFPNGFYLLIPPDGGNLSYWFGELSGYENVSGADLKSRQDVIIDNIYKTFVSQYEQDIANFKELDKQYKSDLKQFKKGQLATKPEKPIKPKAPRRPNFKNLTIAQQKGIPVTVKDIKPFTSNKNLVVLARKTVLKVFTEELISGISTMNIPFVADADPNEIAAFKKALTEFNLLKKIADDSLSTITLSADELDAHNELIDSFRENRVIPIAKQVIPESVYIEATKENLTQDQIMRRLNLIKESLGLATRPVITGRASTPAVQIPSGEAVEDPILDNMIAMITNLVNLLDLIIKIAEYDITSAMSLLGDELNEAKLYQRILSELLNHSRR